MPYTVDDEAAGDVQNIDGDRCHTVYTDSVCDRHDGIGNRGQVNNDNDDNIDNRGEHTYFSIGFATWFFLVYKYDLLLVCICMWQLLTFLLYTNGNTFSLLFKSYTNEKYF